MLAVIIPLKPKKNSTDWEKDSIYLNNTLQSVLNQTNDNYHVFVILHELPQNPIINSKIDYIELPWRYCEFDEIEDRKAALKDSGYLKERDIEYLFDQGRKQMYGAQISKDKGFEYIMSLDADDLVSKNLVEYIITHEKENQFGWFVDKGYYFLSKEKIYLRQPYAMNILCGSSYIIHRDILPKVDLSKLKLGENNFFSNHGHLASRLKNEFGKELKPLPFYAIVYVITNLNWSITTDKLKGKGLIFRMKYLVKYVLRRVLFVGKIRNNFYLGETTASME